jgi:hypothetical protein
MTIVEGTTQGGKDQELRIFRGHLVTATTMTLHGCVDSYPAFSLKHFHLISGQPLIS